jgi:hypothetical protein
MKKLPMKYHLSTFFTFTIILMSGCSNDNGQIPFDVTLLNNGFKGITYTSSSDPTPAGSIDETDWKNDGYWDSRYPFVQCGTIATSFSKRTKIDTVVHSETPTNFKTFPAYPNPSDGSTVIEFGLSVPCHVYASIINDKYQTVQLLICGEFDEGLYSVEWSAIDNNNRKLPDDVYRFIIRCTDDNGNLLFASHGDLWLKY